MRLNSNGDALSNDYMVAFKYGNNSELVWITTEDSSGNNIVNNMPYQEFLEMANEIVRQKEEHDATTTH